MVKTLDLDFCSYFMSSSFFSSNRVQRNEAMSSLKNFRFADILGVKKKLLIASVMLLLFIYF